MDSLGLFIMETYFFWNLFLKNDNQTQPVLEIVWFICFLFSFLHIFLVLMDGWSRFQNYKRVKDQFYIHGFDVRLAANYQGSKCQRSAATVAATELGMENEIKKFFRKRGVKYYHFIPYFMIQDPFFLIKRSFWARTFLEKHYTSKFNFRKIAADQIPVNRDLTSPL